MTGSANVAGGTFDVERSSRATFPLLARQVHGKPLIYLDNANTAQKAAAVIEAVDDFYRRHNANVSSRRAHAWARSHRRLRSLARSQARAFLNVLARRTGAVQRHHVRDQPGRLQPWALAAAAGLATASCSRRWSTTPTSCPGSWCANAAVRTIKVAPINAGRASSILDALSSR
jgi:hypothetical protein